MALILIFLLGVANFAMHRAVQESGHPLLGQAPRVFAALGGWFSLSVEFILLLGCMTMAASGTPGWIWGYAAYSATNAMAAWLILNRRI